jgi:hypothetical protein
VIERTSWWPEAIPLFSITTAECTRALFAGWISCFGVPPIINSWLLSDWPDTPRPIQALISSSDCSGLPAPRIFFIKVSKCYHFCGIILGCYHLCYHLMLSFFMVSKCYHFPLYIFFVIIYIIIFRVLSFLLSFDVIIFHGQQMLSFLCYHLWYHF